MSLLRHVLTQPDPLTGGEGPYFQPLQSDSARHEVYDQHFLALI